MHSSYRQLAYKHQFFNLNWECYGIHPFQFSAGFVMNSGQEKHGWTFSPIMLPYACVMLLLWFVSGNRITMGRMLVAIKITEIYLSVY